MMPGIEMSLRSKNCAMILRLLVVTRPTRLLGMAILDHQSDDIHRRLNLMELLSASFLIPVITSMAPFGPSASKQVRALTGLPGIPGGAARKQGQWYSCEMGLSSRLFQRLSYKIVSLAVMVCMVRQGMPKEEIMKRKRKMGELERRIVQMDMCFDLLSPTMQLLAILLPRGASFFVVDPISIYGGALSLNQWTCLTGQMVRTSV
mmetsp:Transcript_10922/g.23632  ORF Transcript_10922/g.23632 Transcript_10922/m.23632 type:complete len:205 (-) Transcript_10922:575-1189(-)